jgi:hypothetical protein
MQQAGADQVACHGEGAAGEEGAREFLATSHGAR